MSGEIFHPEQQPQRPQFTLIEGAKSRGETSRVQPTDRAEGIRVASRAARRLPGQLISRVSAYASDKIGLENEQPAFEDLSKKGNNF